MLGIDRHLPDVIVNPIECVARTVDLYLGGVVTHVETELLLHTKALGVDAIERRSLIAIGASLVATIGHRPKLLIAVEHQRCRLYAHGQLAHHPVTLRIDFQNAILV